METCRKSRSRCRLLAPLMFLVLLGCSDDGYNYNGVRYDKFKELRSGDERHPAEDAMLAATSGSITTDCWLASVGAPAIRGLPKRPDVERERHLFASEPSIHHRGAQTQQSLHGGKRRGLR